MIHLIQRGLMFGNLIHIESPALIERYNRALKHLTQKQTKLTDCPRLAMSWTIRSTSTMRG